jgi:carboxypeptidase C (cathepsin A)
MQLRSLVRQRLRRLALASILGLGLAACGGGGSSDNTAGETPPLANGDQPFVDTAAYSSLPDAALASAIEGAAVTRHRITLGGVDIAYTARAGHLIARSPDGAAQAKMFHVSYTADGAAAATRPVTFFYNGGPGSASVWLHLGSFGPRRLVTGVPATTLPRPFAMVDNPESLLDTTDLVFVNAVSTGLSQAIRPFSNRSFWGVDADAALFRDFIVRWLEAHARQASPRFLYGESYGGPRSAVLARLLEAAGVSLDGVILQSPAMDYNSNCAVSDTPRISCAGFLPTYALTGAWFRLLNPPAPADDAYAAAMRTITREVYAPAVQGLFAGAATDAALPGQLAGWTGLPAASWVSQLNLDPGVFQRNLLPGTLLGRYDARITAPNGSALASEGDPSSTLIGSSFASAIVSELRDTLRYSNASTYVLLSSAIEGWTFSHAGRELPDTIPDLAAVLTANPRLRVLAVNGYHDLATPFHVTELDLARLNAGSRVQVRNYAGGHMSYLDDATRVRQKADLVAFYRGSLAASAAQRREMPMSRHAGVAVDRVGPLSAVPAAAVPEAMFQVPMREPWVPPRRPAGPGP